ncbi:MAG: amino acid ABC transporter permease [Propionibacteriaceae bacterium]|jgi:polar amino acid transport system permease protein|nr:amino acid ABC transporter permease [Propionibacteriaceae bacterium]
MALVDIRPTVRRRISQTLIWIGALVVILLIALMADWENIRKQFLNVAVMKDLWPEIVLVGMRNTLIYTFISFIVGTALGTVFALMKMSKGPFSWFATAYIELFRGIPALLTIFAMTFILPIAFGVKIVGGAVGSACLGLVIVTSAYTAEIMRAGIEAVPKGQREAARSLGMSPVQTTLFIILPQGFRIVIPPMTNEFVMLLKDSSLIFIAGLTPPTKELTAFARDGLSTYGSPTPLILAAILYLIVTIPLTMLIGKLEKKLAVRK